MKSVKVGMGRGRNEIREDGLGWVGLIDLSFPD
jgi:hypothetical protein